ncbi:TT9 [Symbiodinium natans]|uniref:TT9 protein n=1 Tax=Symbiodinium natans TaxID=878477 RepID=A0A812IIT3_9DINO|nr:TT9 [Symbiodinium natans]
MASLLSVAWSFWEAKTNQNVFPLNRAELAPVLECARAGLTCALPHTNAQADALVDYIHQIGAALGHSEDNGGDLFAYFVENEGLETLVNGLLAFETLERVRVQLWQTVSITLVNAKEEAFLSILHGGAYNRLLCAQPELPTDDSEALYVHLMKRLAMRVTSETAEWLLMPAAADSDSVCLPVMMEAARFIFHSENLARTGARVTCLSMLKIKNLRVQAAATEVFYDFVLPRVADRLQSVWAEAAVAAREEDAAAFRAAAEREEDALDFVVELLGLGLPWVTQAVADAVVAGLLLPQLFVLAPPAREHPRAARAACDCVACRMLPELSSCGGNARRQARHYEAVKLTKPMAVRSSDVLGCIRASGHTGSTNPSGGLGPDIRRCLWQVPLAGMLGTEREDVMSPIILTPTGSPKANAQATRDPQGEAPDELDAALAVRRGLVRQGKH